MDQFAAQGDLVWGDQLRVGQIHREDRVVLLHIGAQQEQRSSVQPQLELRQKARVVQVDTVRIALCRDNVAAAIEQRKRIATFQCARPALLERDVRLDVERRPVVAGLLRSRRGLPRVALGTQAASRRLVVLKTTALTELRRSTSR